jgi:hypothetical protein
VKRFRYAYQVALDVAFGRERVAARKFASARDAHLGALAQRAAIDLGEGDLRAALLAPSRAFPSATIRGGSVELIAYERCLAVYATRRRAADAKIALLEGELLRAHELLATRRNERDALGRYRRRAAEAHTLACDRIESNELDEAAGLAHEARVRDARKHAA